MENYFSAWGVTFAECLRLGDGIPTRMALCYTVRMKIALFIGSLKVGGSERQIALLAEGLTEAGHDVCVFTLYSGGKFWEDLKEKGKVTLHALITRKSKHKVFVFFQLLSSILQLRSCLRNERPAIMYSFLYLTNVIAWFSRFGLTQGPALIWSVRSSNVPPVLAQQLPFLVGRILSRWVKLTISNSHAGLAFHRRHGYIRGAAEVIYNGIDTQYFIPEKSRRDIVRKTWGLESSTHVIGVIGRIDTDKDFPTLLRALSLLVKDMPSVKLLVVGNGERGYVAALQELSQKLNVQSQICWKEEARDLRLIYNGIDILCSSSLAEGFSNVVAEAMSCDVPCVVTEVGDAKHLVGDTGVVVPAQDPTALAAGLRVAICSLEGRTLGHTPFPGGVRRDRICQYFSVENLIKKTQQVLQAYCAAEGIPVTIEESEYRHWHGEYDKSEENSCGR